MVDAESPEVHARIAPLLARTGQDFDAWLSFRAAAEGFMRSSQTDRALAAYYEAAHHLPRVPEIAYTIARLQSARGKPEEAVRALRDGRKRLRRRGDRAQAVYLLRKAHEIEPWNPDIVLDLAWLLWKTRQRSEALMFLEALSQRARGTALRRTRRLQFRISHNPRYAWLWMRTPRSAPKSRPGRARSAVAS